MVSLISLKSSDELLTHLSLVSFFLDIGKQCGPRPDTGFAASDQGLHCLLTECSIKI